MQKEREQMDTNRAGTTQEADHNDLFTGSLDHHVSRRAALGRFAGLGAVAALTGAGLGSGLAAKSASAAQPGVSLAAGRVAVANGAPTVVLVHGAFAESSSWNGVINQLGNDGYSVVAAANPLRAVGSDAEHVASVLKAIDGPIVLVGHSYGGMVITNAATGNNNVIALVYVAALAPEMGESTAGLQARYPGGNLEPVVAPPMALPDGRNLIAIEPGKFQAAFCADVPAAQASLMAITQRPIVDAALSEASPGSPAWKSIPSWFIYGQSDLVIPPALHAFMAQRAGAKETVEVPGASHVVMVSHPDAVAGIIRTAGGSPAQS